MKPIIKVQTISPCLLLVFIDFFDTINLASAIKNYFLGHSRVIATLLKRD
jgi:hypothetical protein